MLRCLLPLAVNLLAALMLFLLSLRLIFGHLRDVFSLVVSKVAHDAGDVRSRLLYVNSDSC
jgi:hypothetical protein